MPITGSPSRSMMSFTRRPSSRSQTSMTFPAAHARRRPPGISAAHTFDSQPLAEDPLHPGARLDVPDPMSTPAITRSFRSRNPIHSSGRRSGPRRRPGALPGRRLPDGQTRRRREPAQGRQARAVIGERQGPDRGQVLPPQGPDRRPARGRPDAHGAGCPTRRRRRAPPATGRATAGRSSRGTTGAFQTRRPRRAESRCLRRPPEWSRRVRRPRPGPGPRSPLPGGSRPSRRRRSRRPRSSVRPPGAARRGKPPRGRIRRTAKSPRRTLRARGGSAGRDVAARGRSCASRTPAPVPARSTPRRGWQSSPPAPRMRSPSPPPSGSALPSGSAVRRSKRPLPLATSAPSPETARARTGNRWPRNSRPGVQPAVSQERIAPSPQPA